MGHRTIASESILLVLIAPSPKAAVASIAEISGVFFETTKVCVASRAFEWPAADERSTTYEPRPTHERPTAHDVASSYERPATDEAAGTHEIAKSPKIRVLTLRVK
jgi:hypothetical protein